MAICHLYFENGHLLFVWSAIFVKLILYFCVFGPLFIRIWSSNLLECQIQKIADQKIKKKSRIIFTLIADRIYKIAGIFHCRGITFKLANKKDNHSNSIDDSDYVHVHIWIFFNKV